MITSRLNGETHYLWRAVDHEGEVLEVFVSNHFNHERHLTSREDFKSQRNAAITEWRQLCAA